MKQGRKERYSRQVVFAELGEEGQRRLSEGCAVIVGCGALGSFQADALARAGAGRIVLIDRDYVEWSNLQRQCLFEEADAEEGLPKAVAAARRLGRVNSEIEIVPVVADLTPENAEELLGGAQVVLDGTDNFETRYLINDFCVSRGIAWIYGGAVGSYAVAMPVLPGETACLKCVYPEPPAGDQPTCETAGVLNVAPQFIAAFQAAEALKVLAGRRESVTRRILTADLWRGEVRQVAMPARDPECPACGRRMFVHLEGSGRAPVSLCGRNAVQIHERRRPIDLEALAGRLARLGEVRSNEFAVRFVTPPYELTIFPDGRAIIKGTSDPALARSLYARYVGS
ncbi:MAG TPA: ThiF family adenylyltransferase [Bryobacteraceae bacterium]|nr:ThiF family adenylyltransferase [Bryobacteraceae bacterium]